MSNLAEIIAANARLAVVRRDLFAIEFLWQVRRDGDEDVLAHQRLKLEEGNLVAVIRELRERERVAP